MAAEQRGKFSGSSFDYDAVLLQMKALEAELKAKDKRIETLADRIKQQELQIAEASEAASLRAELQMKRQQLESAETKMRSTALWMENAQKEAEASMRQLEFDKKRLGEQLSEVNTQNTALAEEINGLRKSLQGARLQEKETNSVLETLNKQVEILTAKLHENEGIASSFRLLESENLGLKKEIDSYSSRLQLSQRSESDSSTKLKELADENSSLRQVNGRGQELVSSHQVHLRKLQEELLVSSREKSTLKKQVEELEISQLEINKALLDQSATIGIKSKEIERLNAQLRELQNQALIDFKIVLSIDEPIIDSADLQLLRLRCSQLELRTAENEGKLRDSWRERGLLQEQLRQQEAREHSREDELKRIIHELKKKLHEFEKLGKEWKDQYFELESQMEEREETIQDLESKIEEETAHSQEQDTLLQEICHQNNEIEKACKILRTELDSLSEERNKLERKASEKESKVKHLNGVVAKLESDLAFKMQRLDHQEAVSANQARQIDILSKKLNQAQNSIKQNYAVKLKQANDKIISFEQEISMLKDMVKSTQLMHNRKKQIIKYSPPLRPVHERSPKTKIHKSFSPDKQRHAIKSPEPNEVYRIPEFNAEYMTPDEYKAPVYWIPDYKTVFRTPGYKSPVHRTPDYREYASPVVKTLKIQNSPFKLV